MAGYLARAAVVGFASGVLSGMFGIGGGIITTPAIRLLLGGTALSAVATPLPVIIPASLTGAVSYAHRRLADVRVGLQLGAWGALAAVAGAVADDYIGGTLLLLVTAVLLGYLAVDMALSARRGDQPAEASARFAEGATVPREREAGGARAGGHAVTPAALAVAGVATGLYSGLLGLGGGFVLVPLLTRWFGFPAKRAVGTSLVAIAVLAVPGAVTHYLLGHIDVPLALALSVTVVPGALLGAKITAVSSERFVRVGFAVLLVVAALLLAVNELGPVLAR